MSKPSIAALLSASGHNLFTPALIQQARDTLYTHAAGLDYRDWDSIMASDNPLLAAQDALLAKYQDPDFLLDNASHLTSLGYTPAQIEWTYRLVYERLAITDYTPDWAIGSWYEPTAKMDSDTVYNQAQHDYAITLPTPSFTISATNNGIQVNLSEAGVLSFSHSNSLGSFGKGIQLLDEQSTVQQGYLTLTGSTSNKSTTHSQHMILGTEQGDSISGTSRSDMIFSGAGDDVIYAGSGNDFIIVTHGQNTLHQSYGEDTFLLGNGNDHIIINRPHTGTDSIINFTTGDDQLHLTDIMINQFDDDEDSMLDWGELFQGKELMSILTRQKPCLSINR